MALQYLFKICAFTLISCIAQQICCAREQSKIRVACVGDSITYGAGIREPESTYPMRLAELLGNKYEVQNFGENGATLSCEADKPYVKQQAYKKSLEYKPNIVVISLGTNDSKPHNISSEKNILNDAKNLVLSYRQIDTKPKIYLCRPIPVETDRWGISEKGISENIWPKIEKAAKDLGIQTINLHSALDGESGEYSDGVHPNPYGAYKIAAEIYKNITGKNAPKRPRPVEFPLDDGNGYKIYNFKFGLRDVKILAPKLPLKGNPWIWRPAFFGAFDNADRALLRRGFYIVYCDFTHEYGNPSAVKEGKKFFDMMTKRYNLYEKVVLEGLSRGGLYAINYAKTYPDTLCCIYVDAPVCNLASWPGRKSALWKDVEKKWACSDIGDEFEGNAYMGLEKLAENKVPVLLISGDSDRTVPFKDNGGVFESQYKNCGGEVISIIKPGGDHHPHGLSNPKPIVDFIMGNYIKDTNS